MSDHFTRRVKASLRRSRYGFRPARSFAPASRLSLGRCAGGQNPPLSPALTSPGREICPAGLTFPAVGAILVWRCPFRSFGGRPCRGVRGRRKAAQLFQLGGFFHAPELSVLLDPLPRARRPHVLDTVPSDSPNATKPLSFCCVRFCIARKGLPLFSSINSRLNFFVCDIYCLCDRHLQLIPYRMSLLSVIH